MRSLVGSSRRLDRVRSAFCGQLNGYEFILYPLYPINDHSYKLHLADPATFSDRLIPLQEEDLTVVRA